MAYQDKKRAHILRASLSELFVATAGFPKTNAMSSYECMQLFLREKAVLEIKPIQRKDQAGRPMKPTYGISIKATMIDTSIVFLQNLMKLSKGEVQVFAKDYSGLFYNFTDNGGTQAAPTGSGLLCLMFEFKNNNKTRALEVEFKGEITSEELAWLHGVTTAYETGGSGGVTNALVANTNSRTDDITPGFEWLKVNGVKVGYFEDIDFSLKTKGTGINRGKELADCMEVKIDGKFRQMVSVEVLQSITSAITNYAHILQSFGDEAWTFATGTLGFSPSFTWGDTEPVHNLVLEGKVMYNVDEATPNSIDFSTPATPTFTLTGY